MDNSSEQPVEHLPTSESQNSERGFNTPKLRELQFQNVLTNVDNGIVFLDKDFNVLYINQRCKDIWEYPDGLDYSNITLHELIDASLSEADFTETALTQVERNRIIEGFVGALKLGDTGPEIVNRGEKTLVQSSIKLDDHYLLTFNDITLMHRQEQQFGPQNLRE